MSRSFIFSAQQSNAPTSPRNTSTTFPQISQKYIYPSEWKQLVQNSRLRSRLVLSSFSMLIGKILHISIALSSDRETRFKEIVRENLKISEDERVSFDVNSPLLLNLKNNQADIKTLTENLIKIYAQNSQYSPEELIIGKIYDEWRKYFNSNH